MQKLKFLCLAVLLILASPLGNNSSIQASSQLLSSIRFAVIGDYGSAGPPESDVANLVKSWNPDFIITLGDNNYPSGSATTIDTNIGQYYHELIYPYTGSYGAGATTNRFFPVLGNHDWRTAGAAPYLNYFSLPGNERYYDFIQGPVHFFALDSDPHEPDGYTQTSIQGTWLQNTLNDSAAPWQVVYFHHPPFSSSNKHGSTKYMQWDFQAWGADAILAGHDHTYERLLIDGLPYFVNGLGGASIYGFGGPVPGSQFRYNGDYGAMLVEAANTQIVFKFYTRAGILKDEYILKITFADVPENHWAWSWIERLYAAQITGGCGTSPLIYCPDAAVNRAQMAVFLLKGIHGSSYIPPVVGSSTGFNDVPTTHWAAAWIKRLAAEDITGGCGGGYFCPDTPTTRAQMAVFLLRSKHGSSYNPPPVGSSTGFDDVPNTHWAAAWIKQVAAEGITGGCSSSNYCPDQPVTRAEMAVFLVRTFNLP